MKNVIFTALLLLGIFMFSCSEDEKFEIETSTQQVKNFVGLDEVSNIASVIQYPLSSNPKNAKFKRHGVTRTKEVENITKVPDENGNTSYYIINYKNGGFVLIAADNRADPILAFSYSKKFPLNESKYPNGLVEWLVRTKDFVKNIRESNLEQSEEVKKLWEN